MKTSNSFRIYFTIKSDKAKNGKAPLYVSVTVNKEKAYIALKETVSLAIWDFGKGGVKGTRDEARLINNYIETLLQKSSRVKIKSMYKRKASRNGLLFFYTISALI